MVNIFVKHWRLIALALGILLFLWILYLLRAIVLPFAIGLILAYITMPLVGWLEKRLPPRHKWPGFRRVISVLITFLLLLAILVGFSWIVVSAVIDASVRFVNSAPFVIQQSIDRIQAWFEGIIQNLPVEIQESVTQGLVDQGIAAGEAIRDAILNSIGNIQGTFNTVLGFAVLPFFLFYVLKDSEKLKAGLNSSLPEVVTRHGRNVVDIIERVLGRYLRAQLLLGLIVGYFSFIGLLLLDIPFPLALALLAGVFELVPNIGPWISGAVAVMVALAMAPDKTLWVAGLYLGIQLLENNLLVPKIQSAYLGIHPAIMIVLIVFGAYVAGIWGILLVGPLAATMVQIIKYIISARTTGVNRSPSLRRRSRNPSR